MSDFTPTHLHPRAICHEWVRDGRFPFLCQRHRSTPGVVCGVAHAGRRSRAKIDGRTLLRNRVQPDGAGTAAGTRSFRVERKVGGSDGGVIARIREVRL